MVVSVELTRRRIDSADLAAALALLDENQQSRLIQRPAADRLRSAAGVLLLWESVQVHGLRLPLPLRFTYGEQDKPFLADAPDFYYNLSHSGDYAVLAVSTAPVGVDFQQERTLPSTILRRFASSERELLSALPEVERSKAFFDLWAVKESYCKCTGLGLRVPLNATEVTLAPCTVSAVGCQTALFSFADAPDYHGAVCVQTNEAIELIVRN